MATRKAKKTATPKVVKAPKGPDVIATVIDCISKEKGARPPPRL